MSREEPGKPRDITKDETAQAEPRDAPSTSDSPSRRLWPRRMVLKTGIAAAVAGATWYIAREIMRAPGDAAFIARVSDYRAEIAAVIGQGLKELGIGEKEIKGKRVLLKPNLVEPRAAAEHINTHPAVIGGAAEAFLRLGASRVVVAEGAGHRRDTFLVLELSGLADVLTQAHIPFVDLNSGPTLQVPMSAASPP